MRKHILFAFLSLSSLIMPAITPAMAADVVLDNTSSSTTVSAGDNVTVPDHAGPDNNTSANWIVVNGNAVKIGIAGTLQGATDLIDVNANLSDLYIKVDNTGEIIASGDRALDIDGSGRVVDNFTIINDGTVYGSAAFVLSTQNVTNSAITNSATGRISGARLAIMINGSSDSSITNAGTISVDNDNVTYRDNLTLARSSHNDGRTINGDGADNLTLTNTGTIHSRTKETLYLVNVTDSELTNSGTITAATNQAVQVESAERFTLTNTGSISADNNTIYGDQLEDSTLTNSDNGTISAEDEYVFYLQSADNASVVNSGLIQSDNGSVFDTNNAVSATITNTGVIKTSSATTDYILTGDNTAFTNEAGGTITSTTNGLLLDSGNSFRNYGNFTVGDNQSAISITGNNNTITFYDNSTYTGTIAGGSGTGNLLVVNNDESYSLTDNISGAIGLTKTGDGVLDITDNLSYTGATTVSAGTLKVNANASGSTITVGSAGTLGGAGTSGSIVNNGTLAPGNSIGTLNVAGDVTLNNASSLEVEIAKNGSSDKIILTGALSVDGALRLISDPNMAYKNTETFEILESGTRTGSFDNITMRACGASLDTSYNSDGVSVTVTGCNAPRGNAVDRMQIYLHEFYDNNSDAEISSLLTALEGLSGADYADAMSTLDVDAPLAIAASTTQGIQTVNGFMATRAAAQSGSGSAQKLRMMMASEPLSADAKLTVKERLANHRRKGMWVKAYGGNGEKEALKELGVNGYDYDFSGTTIGFDLESKSVKQAIALSVQTGSVTSHKKQGYQEYETVMLNYQNTQRFKSNRSLSLSIGGAVTHTKSKRYIDVGAIDQTAKADYRAYALDLGMGFTFAPMRLGPLMNDLTLSMAVNYNAQKSYRETGAGSLSLDVSAKNTAVGRIGIENTMFFAGKEEPSSGFTPFISTGLILSRHLTSTSIKQGSIGNDKMSIATDRDQELLAEIGLGFLHIEDDDDELRFMTKAKYSDKLEEYSAAIDYGLKF